MQSKRALVIFAVAHRDTVEINQVHCGLCRVFWRSAICRGLS
jgi:hypothetical protein